MLCRNLRLIAVTLLGSAPQVGFSAESADIAEIEVTAAQGPDTFRQAVRKDPLIASVIDSIRQKHGGCPWLDDPHGDGGMTVMKEVEPYFYSRPADYYRPRMGQLEIQLRCFHAVAATVHAYIDEKKGLQPIQDSLGGIDFDYGSFYGYLSRYKSVSTTPELAVTRDPLVTNLHPLLTEGDETCDELANGEFDVSPNPSSILGWEGKHLEYREFTLSYSCNKESHGTSYKFHGRFFLKSGFVTWIELEISGWMS